MTSAAKVGILMLIILGILGFLVLRIEDISLGKGARGKTVSAVFDSVAGLDEKSKVRIAGVVVGKVREIKLGTDGRARVAIDLEEGVQLHRGARAIVTNLGLLGEKYIELDPGDPSAPLLGDGESVVLQGSAPASIDQVTQQVSDIATDVKAITASLRTAMGGPEGERRMEEIVANVHGVTARIRMLLEANEDNVNATAANFKAITDDLRVEIPRIAASIERFADSLQGTVGENREDVRVLVENLKGLSADLRVTADNMNSITGQVKSGEGTVGKLIYSDEAHDRLAGALEAVEGGVTELKNTLGRAGRIQMNIGIRSDYLAGLDEENAIFDGNSRSMLSLGLIPNPERNRFYNVEVIDDPKGSKKQKIVESTFTRPDGTEGTITEHQIKYERDLLFSAQAGWQLDDLALRVGIFDNSGGIGADYRLSPRISVTGEAFDFGGYRDEEPHLRVYGQYVLRKEKPNTPALFLTTGVDNPLNDTAYIFGGGIRWNDEDLKYLLGSIPLGN